jgi:GntR family transcriptional regulator
MARSDSALPSSPAPRDSSRIPAYKLIQRAITQRIESGELKPGDRIDSERELARIHGVSLMTARHALQQLERDFVVTRHVGSGTFVSPPRIHFNKLLGFSELMAGRGMTIQSKVLSVQAVDDNEEIAARLRLTGDTRLLRIERLRIGDGEPFALETVYLPHARFADLHSRQLERRSLFGIFQADYQLTLSYADEEVDATAADARCARHLTVPLGAPLLRIRQLLFAAAGEPIMYDIGLYRSERHSLTIRRYR